MCADFCSDIKSLRSLLGAAYDKKSVRVRWLQSDEKSEWCHPTMRPRLLLSHTIAPIKNRSVCADFWSEKKSVRFFLGAACDKKLVVSAKSEKKSDLHFDFFSELLTKKIGPCALGIMCIKGNCSNSEIDMLTNLQIYWTNWLHMKRFPLKYQLNYYKYVNSSLKFASLL